MKFSIKTLIQCAMVCIAVAFNPLALAQNTNITPILFLLLDEECFPGSTVTGDQTLSIQADVEALRGVSQIVSGNLVLAPTEELDFEPLNQLATIKGELKLTNNNVQTQLRGFDCLTEIDRLDIVNTNIENIDGFSRLESISGELKLTSNNLLSSAPSFPALTQVGSFLFENNDSTQMLAGFPLLNTVSGDFKIRNNNLLSSAPSFPALTQVGSFLFDNNDSMQLLTGFPLLNTVSGELKIKSNDVLHSTPSFAELTQVGSFLFDNNDSMQMLTGFPLLNTVSGELRMSNNAQLSSTPSFAALTQVGSFLFNNNDSMQMLAGYALLNTVSAELKISNNAQLSSTPSFAALTQVGSFVFDNNDSMLMLAGFPLLNTVSGELKIKGNNLLTQITGFDTLTTSDIGSDSTISSNNAFDCSTNPTLSFSPVDVSSGNKVNCNLSFKRQANKLIPATIGSSITDIISVPADNGNVKDLMVHLDIDQGAIGGLVVSLSKGATTVSLISFNLFCTGSNIDNTLTDSATLSESSGCGNGTPAYTADVEYKPDGLLSSFDNIVFEGDWTLTVTKSLGSGSSTGLLKSWELMVVH
ncbi:MAG: hypothetical protein V3V09_02735 [Arenicellales bacterium]